VRADKHHIGGVHWHLFANDAALPDGPSGLGMAHYDVYSLDNHFSLLKEYLRDRALLAPVAALDYEYIITGSKFHLRAPQEPGTRCA
jgi:hypothetical protein